MPAPPSPVSAGWVAPAPGTSLEALDWPEVRATEALESLTHHRLVRPDGDLQYPLLVA